MTWIILTFGLLAFSSANQVRSQGLKATAPVTTTTISDVHEIENSTILIQVDKKEDLGIIDPSQDILFDPSLVVARVNRDIDDVSDEKSTWSAAVSNDAKDEESSNNLEDLDIQEDKYYSEPNWYRRQDWKVDEQRPTYKRESYNRFLKYPIFSGR